MDFVDFLNSKEQEILSLIYRAKYSAEENTPLCLLGKKYFGFLKKEQRTVVICTKNAKDFGGYSFPRTHDRSDYNPTKIYINRALRHEAVHVAQGCNNGKVMNLIKKHNLKMNKYKKKALEGSTLVSGNRAKEEEAYTLEDKPKLILEALKKYCFNE